MYKRTGIKKELTMNSKLAGTTMCKSLLGRVGGSEESRFGLKVSNRYSALVQEKAGKDMNFITNKFVTILYI